MPNMWGHIWLAFTFIDDMLQMISSSNSVINCNGRLTGKCKMSKAVFSMSSFVNKDPGLLRVDHRIIINNDLPVNEVIRS